MSKVTVNKGEDIDRALRRLKVKLDAESVLEEVKIRRYFEKNQAKKKRKQRALDRKIKKGR